jgi:hypothetical protein
MKDKKTIRKELKIIDRMPQPNGIDLINFKRGMSFALRWVLSDEPKASDDPKVRAKK